jgi:HAD superfamily hydrolase (TIGR01484 family)
MLLATDLDGTFLGGSAQHREELYTLIKNNTAIQLVFVTGRGLENVVTLFRDAFIPRPHYIISDVGATIVNGHTLEAVEPLQSAIKNRWPGTFNILQHFKNIEWLEYQQVPQQRRCSFFLKDEAMLFQAKELADEINCEVIYSAGKFLDVLPKGVNKGSSLSNLIGHLQTSSEDILVAGDTLNDLAMYQYGYNAVAVGASEDGLLKATAAMPHVYHAERPGAGGILEAMYHFETFKPLVRPPLYVV